MLRCKFTNIQPLVEFIKVYRVWFVELMAGYGNVTKASQRRTQHLNFVAFAISNKHIALGVYRQAGWLIQRTGG